MLTDLDQRADGVITRGCDSRGLITKGVILAIIRGVLTCERVWSETNLFFRSYATQVMYDPCLDPATRSFAPRNIFLLRRETCWAYPSFRWKLEEITWSPFSLSP